MQYEEIQQIAAVAVTKFGEGKNKIDIADAIRRECNVTEVAALLMVEAIDRYIDQCEDVAGEFDNGVLVYLKDTLDDDRYMPDTKVRQAQIGFITGQRRAPTEQQPEHWVWVTWYAGPMAAEAAQCHRTTELGVVNTHAPFAA